MSFKYLSQCAGQQHLCVCILRKHSLTYKNFAAGQYMRGAWLVRMQQLPPHTVYFRQYEMQKPQVNGLTFCTDITDDRPKELSQMSHVA